MSEPRLGRWGVPLAALGLVLASWASLQFARSPAAVREAGWSSAPVELPAELPGFRADAWFLPDDSLLGFVEVAGGPFVMGSDPAVDRLAFAIERWSPGVPQGTVDVPTFHIGRYEVTVGQFLAFVQASGHRLADASPLAADPRLPVANVAWTDALAYTRWLSRALAAWDGTPPVLARRLREGWQVRLPTEAQWEKAARGTDGRIWPWGNEPRRDRANFGTGALAAVGSVPCPECSYGLADMSGNVWEWTRSPYGAYPFDPDARGDLGAEALWVMRGGSFTDGEQNVRAAVRGGADPGARRPFIGFRVVLSER